MNFVLGLNFYLLAEAVCTILTAIDIFPIVNHVFVLQGTFSAYEHVTPALVVSPSSQGLVACWTPDVWKWQALVVVLFFSPRILLEEAKHPATGAYDRDQDEDGHRDDHRPYLGRIVSRQIFEPEEDQA